MLDSSQVKSREIASFDARHYWESRLQKDYSLSGVGYIGLGPAYNQWIYRVRRLVFKKCVHNLRLDLMRAKVLDIGSGTGFYVDLWRELGVRTLTASDITHTATERLRGRCPNVEVCEWDVGGGLGALEGRRFDIVSAMDVLYHVVDDARFARALRNIGTLLKPGGYFIYSDNFVHHATIRLEHQASRQLSMIENLLFDALLHPVRRAPMFVLMNAPVDSRSRLARRVWHKGVKIISQHNTLGYVAGASLFPLEMLCTSLLKESPSTEIMICRRTDEEREGRHE